MNRTRHGFTLVEMMVATALAVAAIGLIATMGAWAYRDRAQHQARHLAIEAANNALEEARATPFDKLTPAWATSKQLTDDPWLPEGKLEVSAQDEAAEKGLKRVIAKVSWLVSVDRPRLEVEIVGFFAAAPADTKGDAK